MGRSIVRGVQLTFGAAHTLEGKVQCVTVEWEPGETRGKWLWDWEQSREVIDSTGHWEGRGQASRDAFEWHCWSAPGLQQSPLDFTPCGPVLYLYSPHCFLSCQRNSGLPLEWRLCCSGQSLQMQTGKQEWTLVCLLGGGYRVYRAKCENC